MFGKRAVVPGGAGPVPNDSPWAPAWRRQGDGAEKNRGLVPRWGWVVVGKVFNAVDVNTSVWAQVAAAAALGWDETSDLYSLRSCLSDNIIYLDINDDKYHLSETRHA